MTFRTASALVSGEQGRPPDLALVLVSLRPLGKPTSRYPPGPTPTGTVATTVLLAVSITDTVAERVLVT